MNITDNSRVMHTTNSESWYNDFADKLIAGNFLLTALEFHAELVESGRELPRLRDFFSNPGNFEHLAVNKPEIHNPVTIPRSSSQATLDSLDLTRYSEDGDRGSDDRVAVLEFELRKAKDTIIALRANLTVATETETEKKSPEKSNEAEDLNQFQTSAIKPHEQRALNFLINEYLLLHGYKLTSITFCDENESQDFDDWDDVGINIKRPVGLLSLYREGLKASRYQNTALTYDFDCQVTLDEDIQKNLKFKIHELQEEIIKLQSRMDIMSFELSKRHINFDNQDNIEIYSHTSLSPDTENFEIVEHLKLKEELETKSDKSNGDWTKVSDRLRKGSIGLSNDYKSSFELSDDKFKNQETLEDIGCSHDKFLESTGEDKCHFKNYVPDLKDGDLCDFQRVNTLDLEMNLCDQRKQKNIEKHNPLRECSSPVNNLVGSSRNLPDKYKNQFFSDCDMNIYMCNDSKITTEWFKLSDPKCLTVGQIVEILSEYIPKIVPNIILNKREEIIPLVVLSICLGSEESVRDKLLNILFNMKKKPQTYERRIILHSLSVIAFIMGPEVVENEVLPQCWEQITHKHVERRLLVAESCFILAPYVSEAIRNSLILSIIKQFLQDREEKVRKAAVNVLALLIILASVEDKYHQLLETSINLLNDESVDVFRSVKYFLYPVLAQWSFCLKKVQSHLFKELLNNFEKHKSLAAIRIVETLLPFLILTVAESDCLRKDPPQNVPVAADRVEFSDLCLGLCDPRLFYHETITKIMGQLDLHTSQRDFQTCNWPELEWIFDAFIPVLLKTGNCSLGHTDLTIGIITCFRYLCLGLGKNIKNYKIKPFLLERLQECEDLILSGKDCQYILIPLFLVGVLSTDSEDRKEMDVTLRKFICIFPSCGVSLIPLELAVGLLIRYETWQTVVLDGIWEGVTHQRPLVRSAAAKLFQSVVYDISNEMISKKVLPALITLSSDPEISVRESTMPTLGLLTECKDKVIKDKVFMILQGLFQDSLHLKNEAMIIQSAKTMGKIYENSDQNFREEVLVPQLLSIATHCMHNKVYDIIEIVTEVFATVSFSQRNLSYNCIVNALLPGLRCLENASGVLNIPYRDRIDSMIKEVERRGAALKDGNSSGVSSSPESKKLASHVVTTQDIVEDVKNKVTKIFHTKPNTLQNVSGIFKKKNC